MKNETKKEAQSGGSAAEASVGAAAPAPATAGDKANYKHLWMTEEGQPDPVTGKPREFWTKIGVAYENRDGSFALYLKAFPVNGRVVMHDPWPREDRGTAPGESVARRDAGPGRRARRGRRSLPGESAPGQLEVAA